VTEEGQISFQRAADATLLVRFSGHWRLRGGLPSASLIERELEPAPKVENVAFDARELTSWDSSVLTFLVEVSELCRRRQIKMDRAGLRDGVARLRHLAEAVPEETSARQEAVETPLSQTRRQ
jgi:phospholipid/cholesterol/gamma-HCH transport system permease protein